MTVVAPVQANRGPVSRQRSGVSPQSATLLLLAAVLTLAVGSLSYGQVLIRPTELIGALVAPDAHPAAARIVIDLRLPRVLAAITAGMAMGLAGVLMQALFRNPLADAWSLGLTAGGQFGAALVVVAGGIAFAADVVGALRVFAGVSLVIGAAVGTLAVALFMAAAAKRVSNATLLVMGLMLGFLSQGLMSVVLHFTNRNQSRIFASWNDATFSAVTWDDLPAMLGAIAIGVAIAIARMKPLSALLLGETYAESLGVNVPHLRRWVLMATVLLVAPVTAYCGPLLFVGLLVPHFARQVLGTARLGAVMPVAATAGALLTLAGDFILHLPWQQHFLHLNAILAVIGSPAVIGLLARSRGMRSVT
jgi:iron complex transport system permease protein